jgi:hypothetical protein
VANEPVAVFATLRLPSSVMQATTSKSLASPPNRRDAAVSLLATTKVSEGRLE